jgi:hypothetical protein
MCDAHEQIRNLLGTYCERMDAGGRGHWTERRYAVDHVGDLSRHLHCPGSAGQPTWRSLPAQ